MNPSRIQADLGYLIGLARKAPQLQLRAHPVRARMTGQYQSAIKGRGMEFDESRPYEPGDDVRNIDWRVTARTGKTHTKLFREERERPVLLSIDARRSMAFASRGAFKSVKAAELAALMAWVARQQGDRVGGEVFFDDNHQEFRPQRGQSNILRLLKRLASHRSETDIVAEDALLAAIRRLERLSHPGSLIIMLSDFRGLDDEGVTSLSRLARHSEVILIHVFDGLEQQLPTQGRYRLGFADRLLNIDAADKDYRQRYEQHYAQRMNRLQRLQKRPGIRYLSCTTEQDSFDVLRVHFARHHSRKVRR